MDLTLPKISEGMEEDRVERLKQQIKEELEAVNKGMAEIGDGSLKESSKNDYGRNYKRIS
jgi:hypothetical protein